jgi:phenylpyruvate tautomerase PptA (4-oxalocrotonate tautomerase family)
MPLVRIAVRRGKDATYRQEIGRIVSKALAVGLRREDVFINLIEVKKENWSFGNSNRSACFGARYHGGKTLRGSAFQATPLPTSKCWPSRFLLTVITPCFWPVHCSCSLRPS